MGPRLAQRVVDMATAWMDEDTEVTPTSSASWRLKMPLPAPMDTLPAAERVELDLDTFDDLDVVTLRRTTPVPALAPPAPPAVPLWAVIASGTLLFAAVATTVALVL